MKYQVNTINGLINVSTHKLSIDLNTIDAIEYDRIKKSINSFQNGIFLIEHADISSDEWDLIQKEVKKNQKFHVVQWASFTKNCILKQEAVHAGHIEVSVNFSEIIYSLNK